MSYLRSNRSKLEIPHVPAGHFPNYGDLRTWSGVGRNVLTRSMVTVGHGLEVGQDVPTRECRGAWGECGTSQEGATRDQTCWADMGVGSKSVG